MTTVKVAAVQAAYVLMDQKACLAKAIDLIGQAAAGGPGSWSSRRPSSRAPRSGWTPGGSGDGDEEWFALLVDQAVVVPGPVTDALGAAARAAGVYLVIGVEEREPHGTTIYNTTLYLGPDGTLLGKHRKLVPTGSERTVWGMGDGSTLPVIDTPHGRLSGLTCWENYMPLARFYLYAQGVDIWTAPTLAVGDGWIASMRHIAREGRCYVIGVNPCVQIDQIPADFPGREQVWSVGPDDGGWVEPGNSVIVGPNGELLAGPGPARGDHPHRRHRPSAQCTPPAGCSIPSGTTTGPTSSASPWTSGPAPSSPSTRARSTSHKYQGQPVSAASSAADGTRSPSTRAARAEAGSVSGRTRSQSTVLTRSA